MVMNDFQAMVEKRLRRFTSELMDVYGRLKLSRSHQEEITLGNKAAELSGRVAELERISQKLKGE